ncbi:hypothetical protein BH18CHL2_BH18CHL2_11810 [soil metagenome]
MRIALFGAAGSIGSAVLSRALENGHEVRALARDPSKVEAHPSLTVVGGDARSAEQVADVLRGAVAVVSAIGTRATTAAAADELVEAERTLVAAMEREGVRRLVFVAGAGVDAAGDRRGMFHGAAGALVRVVARHVVAAKEREFDLVRATALDWTAVRPVRVLRGGDAGGYRVSLERPPGMRITSGGVAAFIMRVVEDGSYIRQAPFIAS